jgi:hypothetical protein
MSQHQARQHGVPCQRAQDRHRRPDAETPQSLAIATGGRMGLKAESRRKRTSPEPGHLMWEASSEMTEAWRDRDARGGRGQRLDGGFAKGDAALPADGLRNTIPAERDRGTPARGGEVSYPARTEHSRSATGLERAALLGLRLLAEDQGLQGAIHRQLARAASEATATPSRRAERAIADLTDRRRKLLDLYYSGKVVVALEIHRDLRRSEVIGRAKVDDLADHLTARRVGARVRPAGARSQPVDPELATSASPAASG